MKRNMIWMYILCLLTFPFALCEETSENHCFNGKVLDSHCKCDVIVLPEYMTIPELTDPESSLTCSGGNAFEAAIRVTNLAQGNPIFVELNISGGAFQKIGYYNLKHFPYVKILNLAHNSISHIENNSFKELKFLETLNLSFNQITTVENHMFEDLNRLKSLSLADNRIGAINGKPFYKLGSLINLDLSGNDLRSVEGSWFIGLKNLQYLSLQSNRISSLELNSFHHVVSLQTLDLSFNELRKIQPVFFRLKNLRVLSLAMNSLETLNENIFKGNPLLEKVNLTGNEWVCDRKLLPLNEDLKKYEVDKEGALCNEPPELKNYTIQNGLDVLYLELKMEESPLCNHSMCSCTVSRDKLIVIVDCSSRGFTKLPEVVPYKTKVLNLNNNKIKSLTIDHIDAVMWSDVGFLHLNNNVIDSLKGLEGTWLLRNLVALHLSNNQLTEIPIHILEQFRGGLLDEVYLSGNPWNCDCNTVRFQTWLQDNYRAVRNFDGICCSANSGIYSNQPIYRLLKSQLCPQHVQLINYLDVLNGIMALAIVLIVSKLSYDYWLQKRTGKLPRFFSLNLA